MRLLRPHRSEARMSSPFEAGEVRSDGSGEKVVSSEAQVKPIIVKSGQGIGSEGEISIQQDAAILGAPDFLEACIEPNAIMLAKAGACPAGRDGKKQEAGLVPELPHLRGDRRQPRSDGLCWISVPEIICPEKDDGPARGEMSGIDVFQAPQRVLNPLALHAEVEHGLPRKDSAQHARRPAGRERIAQEDDVRSVRNSTRKSLEPLTR